MFTVMGSKSEQLLARLVNAMSQAREENNNPEGPGEVQPETSQLLADILNEAEDYLRANEQFIDRLAARGDRS